MASLMDGDRYSRIAEMPWIGADGLAKLQRSSVAILGVGNVGGQLCTHFGLMGCHLTLVDRDVVSRPNLGTQGFSAMEDVGRSKVEARARALRASNDRCSVTAIEADIEFLGMGVLRDVDLVICCLDNRKGRVVVNQIMTRLGVPWIDTALDGTGTMMLGRVAAYDALGDDAACYVCPLDRESLLEISIESAPPGCPVLGATETAETPPTLAISALGGSVAAVAVVTGLKMLLGRSAGAVSRESYFDLDRMTLTTHTLERNPQCLSEHRVFTLVPLEGGMTVRATFERAAESLGGDPVLQLYRRSIVRRLRCPKCGRERALHRVLETMTRRQRSCTCDEPMVPLAGHVTDRITREELESYRRLTWKQLGMPREDVVVASRGDDEIAYLVP